MRLKHPAIKLLLNLLHTVYAQDKFIDILVLICSFVHHIQESLILTGSPKFYDTGLTVPLHMNTVMKVPKDWCRNILFNCSSVLSFVSVLCCLEGMQHIKAHIQ